MSIHQLQAGAAAESHRFAAVSRKEEIRLLFEAVPTEEYQPDSTKSGVAEQGCKMIRERTCGDREICAICVAQYEPGDQTLRLPCFHKFHPTCVKPWLLGDHKNQGTCPLCMRHVLDPLPSKCRERSDKATEMPSASTSNDTPREADISAQYSTSHGTGHSRSDNANMACYGSPDDQMWRTLWSCYEQIYVNFNAEFVN